MKTIKILLTLLISLMFSACGSLKLEETPPFKITSSMYYNLSNNTETNIYIRFNGYPQKEFNDFDSIYFQKKKGKVEIKTINGLNYIFSNFKNFKRNDLILDGNSVKELNNQIPETKKFPIDLKENEAVVSYKIKGKIKYYKIKSIKKVKPESFPSANKQ